MLTPTLAALFGSIATAVAIFGGGLAVEAYKRRRDRAGMALALAGAIDALLGLIKTRRMIDEFNVALAELEAGRCYEFASLIGENVPFQTVTLSYADRLGDLGGELPFRVARFLTYNQGLQHDLARLEQNRDKPDIQARLIHAMQPLWETTRELGESLTVELRKAAGMRRIGPGRAGSKPR